MRKKIGIIVVALILFCGIYSGEVQAAKKTYTADTAVKIGTSMYCKTGKSKLVKISKTGKKTTLGTAEGRFCIQGKNVYYTKKGVLYSVKTNGKNRKKLAKKVGKIAGVNGNSVITYKGKTFYQITGKKKKVLIKDRYIQNAVIYQKSLYVVSGTKIYRYTVKKKAKAVKIATGTTEILLRDSGVYYVNNQKGKSYLTRISTAGKKEVLLEGNNLRILDVKGNTVLYAMTDGEGSSVICLKNGKEEAKQIAKQEDFKEWQVDYLGSGRLLDKKIVLGGSGDDATCGLFTMNYDGTEKKLLVQMHDYTKPEVCGNRLYFGKVISEGTSTVYTFVAI